MLQYPNHHMAIADLRRCGTIWWGYYSRIRDNFTTSTKYDKVDVTENELLHISYTPVSS